MASRIGRATGPCLRQFARASPISDASVFHSSSSAATEPRGVELRAAIAQEQLARVRGRHGAQVEIAEQDLFGAGAGARHHGTRGIADERLAGEGDLRLLSHAVAERGEVTVLEG